MYESLKSLKLSFKALIMTTLNKTYSWVIVHIETGEVILETYNKELISCFRPEKFKVIPILEWLQSLNKR